MPCAATSYHPVGPDAPASTARAHLQQRFCERTYIASSASEGVKRMVASALVVVLNVWRRGCGLVPSAFQYSLYACARSRQAALQLVLVLMCRSAALCGESPH